MGLLQEFCPLVLVFYLLRPYTEASQAAICDSSTYGKPEKSDCLTLFEKFTSPQNLLPRFFDEEQLRVDSHNTWPGVANVFEQPIVQLPKFYAMSMSLLCTAKRDSRIVMITVHRIDTCNFALMPYTNPATRLANPLEISSWSIIKSYGKSLMDDCLTQKFTGGEIFIKSSTYPPASCHCCPEIYCSLTCGASRALTSRYLLESSPGNLHVG